MGDEKLVEDDDTQPNCGLCAVPIESSPWCPRCGLATGALPQAAAGIATVACGILASAIASAPLLGYSHRTNGFDAARGLFESTMAIFVPYYAPLAPALIAFVAALAAASTRADDGSATRKMGVSALAGLASAACISGWSLLWPQSLFSSMHSSFLSQYAVVAVFGSAASGSLLGSMALRPGLWWGAAMPSGLQAKWGSVGIPRYLIAGVTTGVLVVLLHGIVFALIAITLVVIAVALVVLTIRFLLGIFGSTTRAHTVVRQTYDGDPHELRHYDDQGVEVGTTKTELYWLGLFRREAVRVMRAPDGSVMATVETQPRAFGLPTLNVELKRGVHLTADQIGAIAYLEKGRADVVVRSADGMVVATTRGRGISERSQVAIRNAKGEVVQEAAVVSGMDSFTLTDESDGRDV